jgi:hypothetical protein
MAAHQELSWPPVRTFMSAYKENLMAADKCRGIRGERPYRQVPQPIWVFGGRTGLKTFPNYPLTNIGASISRVRPTTTQGPM